MIRHHFEELEKTLNDKDLFDIFTKRKPTNAPIIRRSVIKTVSSPTGRAILNQSKPQHAANPVSEDTILKMKKTDRAPSSSRPSAKQAPRSPMTSVDLGECKYCGRNFASDRLAVHEDICSKTGKKKRKTYDAANHRVPGTEFESFLNKSTKRSENSKLVPKETENKSSHSFLYQKE